jgi:L-ribulose-5-phosphate 3-epimerase
MIQCLGRPIGICSWSLKNDLKLLDQLREKTGIDRLHLDINPAINGLCEHYLSEYQSAGWHFSATMVGFAQEDYRSLDSIKKTGGIVPDECWAGNRERVFKAIDITAGLGVKYLEFHFGFIDEAGSDGFKRLAQKARELADRAGKNDVVLLAETGQETAETLKSFLEYLNHPGLAINFDPGNMILYGKGNPVKAVETVGKWIRHLHVKDAIASQIPGRWGTEVKWGDGEVDRQGVLKAIEVAGFEGTLSIEREAGASRISDIETAAARLREYKG